MRIESKCFVPAESGRIHRFAGVISVALITGFLLISPSGMSSTGAEALLELGALPSIPTAPLALPQFIPTMRPYIGGGYDDFQITNIKNLGMKYVQGCCQQALRCT